MTDRQTFPRSARLLNSGAFKSVFDHAPLRASHRYALILARPNNSGHSRLGLIVAKKHVRFAVQRNRIKRLVREQFRRHTLSVPCDMVFLVRGGIGQLNASEIASLLEKLWLKLERQCSDQ